MRKLFGVGTPRSLQGRRLAAAIAASLALLHLIYELLCRIGRADPAEQRLESAGDQLRVARAGSARRVSPTPSTTGC
jgi:hypothetical protein